MRRLSTALLIASLPLALVRADDPAPKGDLGKLQGEWKTMAGPNKDRPVTFSIKDKAITVKFTTGDGETLNLTGEIKVDDAASPRTIDFLKFKNNGEPMDDSHGLYKVDGDTFTLCVGPPGDPRPTEFKGDDGDEGVHLWTFTRPK